MPVLKKRYQFITNEVLKNATIDNLFDAYIKEFFSKNANEDDFISFSLNMLKDFFEKKINEKKMSWLIHKSLFSDTTKRYHYKPYLFKHNQLIYLLHSLLDSEWDKESPRYNDSLNESKKLWLELVDRYANQTILKLGCGLIRIGRVWGVDSKPIPPNSEAQKFLESAFELGIRFFDTAPAYGLSEKRLGTFLKNLTSDQRSNVTIATKFGEHWDDKKQEPFVDHSYDSLVSSFEQSLHILGEIEVLQLHKASTNLLESDDIDQAFTFALKSGVNFLGASISDIDTGLQACSDKRISYIQLPFNEERMELLPVIEKAKTSHKKVLFNRPFAMGAVTQQSSMITAYKRISDLDCPGVILTGTASLKHLKQNIINFEKISK